MPIPRLCFLQGHRILRTKLERESERRWPFAHKGVLAYVLYTGMPFLPLNKRFGRSGLPIRSDEVDLYCSCAASSAWLYLA